jgi:16S rRNA (guanine(966)-N(2))-methyltransferase RsmD
MAKEALFNILNNHYDFEGLKVLDLFAGIGSISYEFASRGATEVHSVEMNPRCVNFITETSRNLDLKNLFVIRANVFSYLKRSGKNFDIIFADPPYDLDGIETIPDLVFENELLDKDGWLIVEHPANIDFSEHSNLDQHRKYGKVNFSMFSGL